MEKNIMIHYAMKWNQKYFILSISVCGRLGSLYRKRFYSSGGEYFSQIAVKRIKSACH